MSAAAGAAGVAPPALEVRGVTMRFGISVMNFGDLAEARVMADLAREAEHAGWEALLVWDHLAFEPAGRQTPRRAPCSTGKAMLSSGVVG